MINRLDLKTFKCFELLRLPLGRLTLLSGTNASGKSSILHSLVLLHQTFQEYDYINRIALNGDQIRLGTVTDVVDQKHGRNSFEIGLTDDESSCLLSFSGDRSDMSMRLDRMTVDDMTYDFTTNDSISYDFHEGLRESFPGPFRKVSRLNFITAEREGPRDVYALEDRHNLVRRRGMTIGDDEPHAIHQQFYKRIGSRGENAVSVLYWDGDDRVAESLRVPGTVPTLMHQVGARMDSFFPGCALALQAVPPFGAVTLGIRISEETDFLRPVNCGFGITQVLPIVVTALSVPQNDLFLLENPEVHLHPAGQALMGQFLAELANYGIQVIVETHSDHVLNGVRRAVKAGMISAENVVLHFFRARTADAPQVLSPTIDNSGNIDSWPQGFFDQFDKDMDFFAGWGK